MGKPGRKRRSASLIAVFLLLSLLLSAVPVHAQLLTDPLPEHDASDAARPAAHDDASAAVPEFGTGLIPSEGELRFSRDFASPDRMLLQSATLPSSYGFTINEDGSLNVWNQTVAKNQKKTGSCVMFSGMAALESYLLLHGEEQGVYGIGPDVDLSELHALYATSIYGLSETDVSNPLYGESVNRWTFNGTFAPVWISYVMRGGPMGGPILESDDPAGAPTADLSQPVAFRYVPLTEKLGEARFVTVENVPFLTGDAGELNDATALTP